MPLGSVIDLRSIIVCVFLFMITMAVGGEVTLDLSSIDEPLTTAALLRLTVAELRQEITKHGAKPVDGSKADLQVQLLALVAGRDEPPVDADPLAQALEDVQLLHEEVDRPAPGNSLHSPPASRRFSHQADTSLAELELKIRLRELEIAAERERQAVQLERDRMVHELALAQLQQGYTGTMPAPAPRFRVDAAVKLVQKFDENDVESFLISFERIAHLNAWPEDKYSAILQAHLSDEKV